MNHPSSDPPSRDLSHWRGASTGGTGAQPGESAGGRTQSDGQVWFATRLASLSVHIFGPLPERWNTFFADFRRQVRRIPLPTRREIVRHMWRQFAELPMVEVRLERPQPRLRLRREVPLLRSKSSLGEVRTHPAEDGSRRLGDPRFEVCDWITPDDMLRILHMVSRAVRRKGRWQW